MSGEYDRTSLSLFLFCSSPTVTRRSIEKKDGLAVFARLYTDTPEEELERTAIPVREMPLSDVSFTFNEDAYCITVAKNRLMSNSCKNGK